MRVVLIFGPPGSGKGTQSEKIAEKYSFAHVSTGDVIRAEIATGSEDGKLAKALIEDGQLIPDDLMITLLLRCFNEIDISCGVILDGFPRTVLQAQGLKALLRERDGEVSIMLDMKVPDEEIVERLVLRGETSGRSDDNEDIIRKRIKIYHEKTEPVLEFYKKEGLLCSIDGTGTIEEIFERICIVLDQSTSK